VPADAGVDAKAKLKTKKAAAWVMSVTPPGRAMHAPCRLRLRGAFDRENAGFGRVRLSVRAVRS